MKWLLFLASCFVLLARFPDRVGAQLCLAECDVFSGCAHQSPDECECACGITNFEFDACMPNEASNRLFGGCVVDSDCDQYCAVTCLRKYCYYNGTHPEGCCSCANCEALPSASPSMPAASPSMPAASPSMPAASPSMPAASPSMPAASPSQTSLPSISNTATALATATPSMPAATQTSTRTSSPLSSASQSSSAKVAGGPGGPGGLNIDIHIGPAEDDDDDDADDDFGVLGWVLLGVGSCLLFFCIGLLAVMWCTETSNAVVRFPPPRPMRQQSVFAVRGKIRQ